VALDIHAVALAPIAAAGWVGQTCFFSRFLVQWWASERARRPVVPRSFWWLSIAGAALVSVYAVRQGELLLLPGLLANGAIAIRNQLLMNRARAGSRSPWLLLPVLILFVLLAIELRDVHERSLFWLGVVGVGQALWIARFPLQWWQAERSGRSSFTPAFWWSSLVGNLLLLAYAVRLGDPVFIAGFALGPLVQTRNLWLGRGRAQAA